MNSHARLIRRTVDNGVRLITPHDFGKFKQYGKADVARFGGTTISKMLPNPAVAKDCKPV